jgi:ribosomal protein S18 acetylase RimI-like enzyme
MNPNPKEIEGKMRSLDPIRDLNEVADLIELCFIGAMDDDGKDYIQYLRKMAREAKSTYWGTGSLQRAFAPLQGFIYEVNGKIIGNLSMLPFRKHGEFIYLIANVAVHPEFRRKGIARKLTTKALTHARIKSATSAWLQVRNDNPAAQQLYIDMGFEERCIRSTWTLKPGNFIKSFPDFDWKIRLRRKSHWRYHKMWLSEIYPETIRWNLGFKEEKFQPGFLPSISRFLNGSRIYNWEARHKNQLKGIITLERTSLFSDNLWVASSETWDQEFLPIVMQHINKSVFPQRPMTVNYPCDRADEVFRSIGFEKNHTLIWMEVSTNRPLNFD